MTCIHVFIHKSLGLQWFYWVLVSGHSMRPVCLPIAIHTQLKSSFKHLPIVDASYLDTSCMKLMARLRLVCVFWLCFITICLYCDDLVLAYMPRDFVSGFQYYVGVLPVWLALRFILFLYCLILYTSQHSFKVWLGYKILPMIFVSRSHDM